MQQHSLVACCNRAADSGDSDRAVSVKLAESACKPELDVTALNNYRRRINRVAQWAKH